MDKHLDAETLSDYAEGLPDAHARAAADAHLAGCAQCRRELAAIQAYFRDMADLEPARAPADFLSRVRARLPRPSPWERAWAAILIPFRFIPVPIAVGVIIGVTAITVYMRQGGLETRAVIPAPAAEPAAASAEPAVEGSSPTVSQPSPKDNGHAPEGGSAEGGPVPPVPSASPPPSASAPPAAFGSRDAKETAVKPSSPAKGAPAQPTADGASRKLNDLETQGWLDQPSAVYILKNSSAPAELPMDKSMPVEERNAVPGQAEAAAGHAAEKRKDEEADRKKETGTEARGNTPPTPAKQTAAASLPTSGYALSLRAKSDTAAVLAGLRSMGVEAESEYASPGESRFRLIVPAPMLRELGPYLARHGVSRMEGRLPSAASDSVLSVRLRLLFPAR